jgi:2-(1,2-epoxy-1,2-dihydrophenyl)acetyl-CoA isomerase
METKTIRFTMEQGIATLTMNRPGNLNAINLEMLDEMLRAIFSCTNNREVRVIILRGEGRAFSSGGDIKVMENILDQDAYTFMRDWIKRVHLLEMQLRTIPKPVIAAVQGVASGQGMNLALACDLRIAAESASFNQSFVNLGLTSEGTYFLPRLVGVGKATELFFTGESISAAEALSLGMLNRVVPDDQLETETRKWAVRMAEGPTEALGRTKLLINSGYRNQLDQHLAQESSLIAETARTEDFREAVKAFLEKRQPHFQGL